MELVRVAHYSDEKFREIIHNHGKLFNNTPVPISLFLWQKFREISVVSAMLDNK